MVDAKAEEDDEEGFGDFTFASFPNSSLHSDQINGRKSADDDEWGDFVESPLRSELSSGSFNAQSPSLASKPFAPFGFFPDQSNPPSQLTAAPTESARSREETQWVKPKGALPLSLFGDVEQEKEQLSSVVDPPVDDKHAGNVRNGSKMFIGLAVNEIIANLYNQSEQIKAENGLISDSNDSDSNLIGTNGNSKGVNSIMNGLTSDSSGLDSISDLFAGNNDIQSPQIKAVSGLASNSSGLDFNTEFFSANNDFDPITNLSSQNQLNKAENSNGFSPNLSTTTSNLMGMDSIMNAPGGNEEFEGDDDGWEFKDAYSESKVGDGIGKVGKEQKDFEVTGYSFDFGNGSHQSVDIFSSSNGFSGKPREVDFGFDFNPVTVAQNGFSSDSFFKSEQNGTQNVPNSYPVVGTIEANESFGDFEGAFTETGLNQEYTPKFNDQPTQEVTISQNLSQSEFEGLASDGKSEGNETVTKTHKGALALSIFGEEEQETDDSSNGQDAFTFKPPSHSRNGISGPGSNISIDDLISNLCGQAEQIPSVDNTTKLTGNGFASSDKVLDPNLVIGEDDFDDASWEFKDASIQNRVVEQTSLHSSGDTHQNLLNKLKLNNYLDFYCNLKDELSFVCRRHLDKLKKAKTAAALSGEDTKVAALQVEIQEACKELHKENTYLKEYSDDEPSRDVCLNDFLEVLHELKFQVLESEYDLSRRLHLAEKDLRSAIELVKHTTSMLNVLTLASVEDQCIYVSTWYKMISVCAQELKHGSWIWKQLVEKNIQSRILSEPRGKLFILSLGEIYRVVVLLGASTKLYKLWILSSSVDSTTIYTLLEECHNLWSSSGIEEALYCICDPVDFDYHSTVDVLRESIKFIRGLDEVTLGNHVFNQRDSVCQLSLLTSKAVPEMKIVFWSGEYYFLTLANLWANLVSCDPPELPHLDVGS